MTSKTQESKHKVTVDVEAGKKAFHEAMAKAQSRIDVATAEIDKLRADLKTEHAAAKAKTKARIDELTKKLDATRKEQQDKIEARLKEIHTDIDSINAEMAAQGKAAVEAKAKAFREEYDATRSALTASLDAELDEWQARISTALDAAAETNAGAKAAVQAKMAELHAKHAAAQKQLQVLKQANAAAFNELHHGVRKAIAEVKTAVQHAHSEIVAA